MEPVSIGGLTLYPFGAVLAAGVLLYLAMTGLSYKKACADFEKVDL